MDDNGRTASSAEITRWAKTTNKKLCKLAKETKAVCPAKEHAVKRILLQFESFVLKLAQVLKELVRDAETLSVNYMALEMELMEDEVKNAETLINDISGKSSLYLLTCWSTVIDQVKGFAKSSGTFLENVILEESSDSLRFHVSEANQLIERGVPKLELKDQLLCNSFEDGALDSIVADYSLSIKVAEQIAESLQIPLDSDAFSAQLEKLKVERTEAEEFKGKVHSLYLEQFIVLLEKAIASKRKPIRTYSYVKDESSHGHRDIPMLPLQSFICSITKDIMRDPVQIASGQTYERAAIERWFEEGHTRCPTGVELKNIKMKSNFALKQSIAEWRERNYDIRLENAHEIIENSEDEEERLKAVQDLQALCEEDSLNKYKVAAKDLIPKLVRFTKSPSKLAVKAISTLTVLAKDNAENQGIMVENGIIDLIVRCLVRQKQEAPQEAPQAVYLLRLLSENQDIAKSIGHARNAILFLVTLMQEEEFAENVGAILENLPKSDSDVITMAKANIMKPLVSRLIEGEFLSQILMAKTLGRLHMPDKSKELVATTETISVLIDMTKSENNEACAAAISALENLSSVLSISKIIENIGGIPILVKQLSCTKSSEPCKTGAAHVLSNIFNTIVEDYEENNHREAQLEELISTFMSLMGRITPPDVHYHLLQGMIGLANGGTISTTAKTKMKENNAFKLLINLWETATDQKVRERAVQLFGFLSSTFGVDACSALKEKPGSLKVIMDMLKDDYSESDHAVAASILSDLPPEDKQISSLLLQANMMPQLVNLLENVNDVVVEACVGALLRFCLEKVHQQKLAEMKVIQKMISLLSSERSLTKERAARALYYFSKSTPSLCKKPDPPKCFGCFSSKPVVCKLHHGFCHIESSYCLLEAGAIKPLALLLKEQQMSCVLTALKALSTLVDDRVGDSETGCRLIDQENGVLLIIGLISSGTPEVQEICANLCEKFFNMADYRNRYGSTAQMHIIGLAQKGSPTQRQIAGRILRQLELLDSQSNYFAMSAAGNS